MTITDNSNSTSTTSTDKKPAVSMTTHGLTLRVAFGDGRLLDVDTEALAQSIRDEGLLHGLKQKLGDAAALARNTTTGRSATIDDKYNAVREVFDRITLPEEQGPTWNKNKQGAPSGSSLLTRALMQLTGKSREAVTTYLEEKTREERAALKRNRKIATIILELQSANAHDNIDSDDLLNQLSSGEDEPTDEEEGEL